MPKNDQKRGQICHLRLLGPDLYSILQNGKPTAGFLHLRLMVFSFCMPGGTNIILAQDPVFPISLLTL